MTTLRTTVIMKTDIQGSTARFRELADVDLDTLLRAPPIRFPCGGDAGRSRDASIFISGEVRTGLVGTSWERRLHRVDFQPTS